jgi:hypothetical protein
MDPLQRIPEEAEERRLPVGPVVLACRVEKGPCVVMQEAGIERDEIRDSGDERGEQNSSRSAAVSIGLIRVIGESSYAGRTC